MAVLETYKPADLMTLEPPEGTDYELLEGELITVGKAGHRHEETKYRINRCLIGWVLTHDIGKIYSESLFPIGGNSAFMPDVAFISHQKLNAWPVTDGHDPFRARSGD